MAVIERLLPPPDTHRTILECGAGGGFYTREFLAAGYHVTGIDLSAEALAVNACEAQRIGHTADLELRQGDFVSVAQAMAVKFDIVVFIKVLHHFEDLRAIHEAIDIALDRLRPGGVIVIFEPNGRNPLWRPFYVLQKGHVPGRNKWFYEKNLTLINEGNLRRYLESRGLEYHLRFHYVIPATLLGTSFFGLRIPSNLNVWLERSRLGRWAANLSVIITG